MNGYTLCEYIQSDGNQYINTGIYPNQNTKIEISAYTTDTSNDKPLFGERNGNNVAFLAWTNPQNSSHPAFAFHDTGNVDTYFGFASGVKHTIVLYNGVFSCDGEVYSFATKTFNSNYELLLFGLNNAGSVDSRKFYGRVYSCKIYDGETLVRDFIPCMNTEGVYGLYDNVNDVFYSSATDSGFTGKWAEQKCLNLTPQEFRHRLMSIGQDVPKIWIQIAKDNSNSGYYRRHIQNVPTDRKIYGVALLTGASYARMQWFTHIKFSTTPVDPSIYTEANINGQFTGKRYDESNTIFDILTYDTSYTNKCAYRTKFIPTDEWSSYRDIGTLPTEELNINGIPSLKTYYTFYFENPLYLVLLQESVDVSKFYILIDETPEPQELLLYV